MSNRSRKAYFLAFNIFIKYLTLYYLSKFLGKKYWENRIHDLHKKSASKIKKTLLDLKGLYIKVGQLISTLSNILPEEFREPLESLQDQLPPRPYLEIKSTIEEEFKQPIETVFLHFNKTALASASIGQTHKAKLINGTEVVVKIQHKDINEIAKEDLKVIKNLVKLYARFFSYKGINYMYSQVKLMIYEELDYNKELKSMFQISNNLKHSKGILVPKVFKKYSNKKIITSAYVQGVKITNLKQLDLWNIDRKELASRFVKLYCKMIFEDDIFHADPHPGNILVKQNGEIVLLDFGAVTSISNDLKTGLPELLFAFNQNDMDGIIKAMRKMGFLGSGKEARVLAEKFIRIGQDFFKNEIEIKNLNLDGITIATDSKIVQKLLASFNLKEISNTIQIPKDWVLLQRVFVLVLGVSNELDPKMDLEAILKPYFKKLLIHQKGGAKTFISNILKKQFKTIFSLPNDLKNTLEKVNEGKIELNVNHPNNINKLLSNTLQQIVFVLLTIASVYFANYFHKNDYFTAFTYAKWLGIIFFAFFLRFFLWRKK